MPRATRLSGTHSSPSKSDGSQSSSVSSYGLNKTKKSNSDTTASPEPDHKLRVLRRHSTQNVSGEIRAFFAVSALPTGKGKQDFLVTAVDSVSQFWEGPRKDSNRTQGTTKSHDDSTVLVKSTDPSTTSAAPITKHWLTCGLYAGSRTSADNSKLLGKGRKSDPGPGAGRRFKFTLPIFHGKMLIDQKHDFKLPWNFYATTGEICKPPNWSRVRRNIHIDVDPYDKKADRPECFCRVECDEACLNRAMFYECDDQNCGLDNPADCSNRTFQHAAIRYADHKARSCGFEVFNTGERGFGLRALRDFEPNAFILEYRGELISVEESEHRMLTMYEGRSNYYFLNVDAGTVLDAGRKGSEARFANHSCAPNARIEKWIVKGEPRIGVFAGKKGIEAGQEITYDYNFSWFEGAKEQVCKCGAPTCRGFIGKRKAIPPPPKVASPKSSPKKSKGKSSFSKVARVVKGRITKVKKTQVKAQVKKGRIVKVAVVKSKAKVAKVKPSTRKPLKPVKQVTKATITKKSTVLGKRKRPSSSSNAVKKSSLAKKTSSPGKAVTTIVQTPIKTLKGVSDRLIYDTVRNRPRKRKIADRLLD